MGLCEVFELTDGGPAGPRWSGSKPPSDIVVSNAGHAVSDTFEAVTDETWARELAVNLTGAILERLGRLYPIGRIVEPAEVSAAALFLVGPAASAITGVVLPVDGGLMAGNLPFIEEIR